MLTLKEITFCDPETRQEIRADVPPQYQLSLRKPHKDSKTAAIALTAIITAIMHTYGKDFLPEQE